MKTNEQNDLNDDYSKTPATVLPEFRNPRHNGSGGIDCEINHADYGWIPFSSHPDDPGANFDAAALFAKMKDSAAEYVPPPPPTKEEIAAAIRAERDAKLRLTDWTQLPDVPEKTRALWANYRQALRDVPQQEGFPWDAQWPDQPRPEQPYPSWVWENDQWNPPVPHPDETGEKLYGWDEQTLTWIEMRLVRFDKE